MGREAGVADRLDELERVLDVGARGGEIALVLVGARAPLEDLGAQAVARAAGAGAELEGERQVVDGSRVGAPLDADAADPEEHFRAVEVAEPGPVRDLLRRLEQRQRLVELASVHLRPGAGSQAAQSEVGKLAGDDGEVVQQSNGVIPTRFVDRLLHRDDLSPRAR